jgi:NitT/TauT family transport system substrate-binding protein
MTHRAHGTSRTAPPRRRLAGALAALALLGSLAACGDSGATAASGGSDESVAPAPAKEVRLGYFGNVTHAPALVGVGKGFLAEELGTTRLRTQVFNAGPAAIEALNAGAIDATYIGPSPAINAFVKSDGEALRIVSGATSGGAQLVVRPGIDGPADLKGKKLASPQLGGTQDVALRAWLAGQGLQTSPSGEGDVKITPTENAQTLQLFQSGKLDGAWLPEPWASRLVLAAGAKVLVDEKSLWPGGKFLTTHLIVATRFLQEHPQTVEALLRANLESIEWIRADRAAAEKVVNEQIAAASGKPLEDAVIQRAFGNIEVGTDPLAGTLDKLLADGVTARVTKKASLDGIYDLRLLNKVLAQEGQPAVSAAGLGKE